MLSYETLRRVATITHLLLEYHDILDPAQITTGWMRFIDHLWKAGIQHNKITLAIKTFYSTISTINCSLVLILIGGPVSISKFIRRPHFHPILSILSLLIGSPLGHPMRISFINTHPCLCGPTSIWIVVSS